MRKQHQPNVKTYEQYFKNQAGGATLPGFRGASVQRGYGLGSMFRSLFRFAFPLVKSGAKTVGKTALNTGIEIAKDALAGKNLRTAAVERAREAGGQLKQRALTAVKNTLVSQTGTGRKRKAAESKTSTTTKRAKPSRAINKETGGVSTSRPSARKAKTSQGNQRKGKPQSTAFTELGPYFKKLKF